MSLSTSEKISILCDKWYNSSNLPGGGIAIGPGEQFRLLANGIVFHELDYESTMTALIGLSKALLLPGLNSFIDKDHLFLWAWCGELLLSPKAQIFSDEQREIRSLFEVAIHAALANAKDPAQYNEGWEAQLRAFESESLHARQLIIHSHLALSYIAFPLLEAIAKRFCFSYISSDGTTISEFSILQKNGKLRTYKKGSKCSSLRDLLHLQYNITACPHLKSSLDQILNHLSHVTNNQEPFDLIYSWRNQSLHGSANFRTIGGTMLNLSLIILISEIRETFEKHRARAITDSYNRVEMKIPFGFYPPY